MDYYIIMEFKSDGLGHWSFKVLNKCFFTRKLAINWLKTVKGASYENHKLIKRSRQLNYEYSIQKVILQKK